MTWSASDMPDQTGKVAIVTGGNIGLGYETAKALLKKGARVIIASRSEKRGADAVKTLQSELGSTIAVEFMLLDLARSSSIRAFSEAFHEKGTPLHILINNAGVAVVPHAETEDGYEITVGINHFGTFLLTMLLLDVLKSSAPSRVVTVSSLTANGGEIDWTDIALKNRTKSGMKEYSTSKLYNVMFAKELARQLQGTGVKSYFCQPGFAKSDIVNKMEKHFWLFLVPLMSWMQLKTEVGCLPILYAATSPDVEAKDGSGYGPNAMNRGITNSWDSHNKMAHDVDAQKKLWVETEKMVKVQHV